MDRAVSHGMLVLGQETAFFYHLPMFMSPHDYQTILEGTFSQAGADPQRTYREDRHSHPDTRVYTFAPDPFVLPELFPPDPKRKRISGELFRGHFEQPAEYPDEPASIGAAVDVTIGNVIFVQKLLPLPTPLDGLAYVLFGKGKELFLAHLLTRKGDFDQVVSAEIRGRQFTDDELRHGVTVRFTGKANTVASRLVEGKAVSGTANVANAKVAVEVVPTREFYMSERDLA
ncbi:hypothetical protein [Luteitalea pratensis]|uniref:hypothetical protein n=1 Tax=Luteitalea pratensis TaxID=1855912 RepID=UPI0012FF7847|nr:hypothetical protein [Luteitalea pratensis]